MSRYEYNDSDSVPRHQASLLEPPALPSRRSRSDGKRRLRFPEPQVPGQAQAQPIPGIPSPAAAASGQPLPTLNVPPSSPPPDAQSPATEAALLPGGGVEVPPGFRFQQEDQGRYRSSEEEDEEGPGQPRVLGGLGLGIFKNLLRLPAALRAGRGDRSRTNSELYTPPESYVGQLPIDDDVETYFTQAEEDEARARQQDDLLTEYVQRNRRRRDHAWRRLRNVDRERYVPTPQPIPVPGSRVPSAVGYAEAPPESALEQEEMAEEAERYARAQEYERSHNIYAAEAVRPPSSPSRSRTARRAHHRVTSTPLPTRIFSHWAADRDVMGRRLENRSEIASASDTSTFSFAGLLRFIQHVRDLPWVGERVAADFIPGGLRASYSGSQAMSGTSYFSPSPVLPLPPSKSWYAPRDSILFVPDGVDPPEGFVPYPYELRPPMVQNRPPSRSSQTHVDSSVAVYPHNPPYGEEPIYHYMPAEASATGKSYVFVPPQQNGQSAYALRGPRSPGG